MKKREIKKEVKLLAKQKKFEQIYNEYGPQYFRKYVSRKYKKREIKKLRQEGRYLDIYEKYGKLEGDTKDVENELGKKMSWIKRIFNKTIFARNISEIKSIFIKSIPPGIALGLRSKPSFITRCLKNRFRKEGKFAKIC